MRQQGNELAHDYETAKGLRGRARPATGCYEFRIRYEKGKTPLPSEPFKFKMIDHFAHQ